MVDEKWESVGKSACDLGSPVMGYRNCSDSYAGCFRSEPEINGWLLYIAMATPSSSPGNGGLCGLAFGLHAPHQVCAGRQESFAIFTPERRQ